VYIVSAVTLYADLVRQSLSRIAGLCLSIADGRGVLLPREEVEIRQVMEVGQHGICNAPAQLKARFLIVADASTRTEEGLH
jgi:hypothetical protein